MESRGALSCRADAVAARECADAHHPQFNDQLAQRASDWQRTARPAQARSVSAGRGVASAVPPNSARELARLGAVESPAAARQLGRPAFIRTDRDGAAPRSRGAGCRIRASGARRSMPRLNSGIDTTTAWMIGSERPCGAARRRRRTGAVARRGAAACDDHARHRARSPRAKPSTVPYGARGDEIGALSRSIGVFQARDAAATLSSTARSNEHAEARERRQEKLSAEMSRHSSRRSRAASPSSAPSAIRSWNRPWSCPALPTARRIAPRARLGASSEASANVRDIASAADELAASVHGDRPPGRAVERHRREGGRRGRAHQRGGEGAERGRPAHRRRGQAHHRHRRADQSAGAQRHHRGRARRRRRPRLCGGGGRGQGAGRPDRQGDRGHRARRSPTCSTPPSARSRRSARSSAPSATSARSAARSRPR